MFLIFLGKLLGVNINKTICDLNYMNLIDILTSFGLGSDKMVVRIFSLKCFNILFIKNLIHGGSIEVMKSN